MKLQHFLFVLLILSTMHSLLSFKRIFKHKGSDYCSLSNSIISRVIRRYSSNYKTINSTTIYKNDATSLEIGSTQALDTMDLKKARKYLKNLDKTIQHHDDLYYNKQAPILSDTDYDFLVQTLISIVEKFPTLKNVSNKLSHVGSTPKGGGLKPFTHTMKMLSLDNAFVYTDIQRFHDRVKRKLQLHNAEFPSSVIANTSVFILEPKIDGLSLALHYEHGVLVRAGTRGDGEIGEDVTETVNHIPSIPKSLFWNQGPIPPYVEIRGEVYIKTEDFKTMNDLRVKEAEAVYSNARNAASGLLRKQYNKINTLLNFFAYNMYYSSSSSSTNHQMLESYDQIKVLSSLKSLGFEIASLNNIIPSSIGIENIDCVSHLLEACQGMCEVKDKLPYNIDGVVIKVDSLLLQNSLGVSTRTPKWAIAYKCPSQAVVTELLDIKIQVGRTGVLTPVAVLAPVAVGGVIIERATLHNQDEINRLKLRPGKRVIVIRSGDVIPKILGLETQDESEDTPEAPFVLPSTCPVCGSATAKDTLDSSNKSLIPNESVVVRCTGGILCSAQCIENIKHFCSRDAADIKGIGEAIITELYSIGLIESPLDLYRLQKLNYANINETDKLENRKHWGQKSLNKMYASIESRRQLPLDKFIYALGIRGIGKGSAEAIASHFISFQNFWDYMLYENVITNIPASAIDEEDIDDDERKNITSGGNVLRQIKNNSNSLMPSKTVDALLATMKNPTLVSLIQQLASEITILDMKKPINTTSIEVKSFVERSIESSVFYGKSVAFTGKMISCSRRVAEEKCKTMGGRPVTTVSSKCDFVVVGGIEDVMNSSNTAKLMKAKALGVTILTETEWIKMTD